MATFSLTSNRYKWVRYLAGVSVFLLILYEAQGKGDFNIFISASRDMWRGIDIYHVKYNHYYHYYYDLFFLLILYPFSFLPLYLTKVLWLIINVWFVIRIWQLILEHLPDAGWSGRQRNIFIFLTFLFVFRFIRDNFHLSQVTIFLVWLSLEGLYRLVKRRQWWGGMLIASGITIKLFPLVLLPYLVYRAAFRPVAWIIFFTALLLAIPVLFLGQETTLSLMAARWDLINPISSQHILDVAERSFHSLSTLLSTLLVSDTHLLDPHALTLRRNIADLSLDQLNIVINAARSILILLTLWFLRSLPFRKTDDPLQQAWELAYLFLITPLIFPHQQHYAFFYIMPAACYLLYYTLVRFYFTPQGGRRPSWKRKKRLLTALLAAIYFLTNSHFILGEYSHLYDHYKTLTYGVLAMVVVLACLPPGRPLRQHLKPPHPCNEPSSP